MHRNVNTPRQGGIAVKVSRSTAWPSLLVIVLAVLAAGCGGTASTDKDAKPDLVVTGPVGMKQDAAEPTDGGILRVGTMYAPGGLDPVAITLDGSFGGSELAAVYDVLITYDPATREYAGRLADSIEPNADATEWTLKLREGTVFSDGSALDAAAVKSSIERFATDPASVHYYPSYEENLAQIATPDPLTVVFRLDEADTNFPWVLTQAWGMVTSSAALKEMDQGAFSQAPVGAGPFRVTKYVPNERLELRRNESYREADSVHLDGVDVSWVPDPSALSQALSSKDLDVVLLRDPKLVKSALADSGVSGYAWKRHMSSVLITNLREERPTSDIDLRRAIMQALDPDMLNTRLYAGAGHVTTELFPSGALHNDVGTLEYDPDAARKLVQDVKKRTGWDGELVLAGLASSETSALAVQASLGAAGIEVKLDLTPSYGGLHKRLTVSHDFDLTLNAYSVDESNPMVGVQASLLREDSLNIAGYANDEMAAAVAALGVATSDAELSTAAGQVQKLWNEQIPSVSLSSLADVWLWNGSNVWGITPTAQSISLFATAWKAGGE